MRHLWRKAPQPAYDLATELGKTEGWNARTAKTVLNRLVRKKAVGFEKYKNLYLYKPLIKEKDCIRIESDSFLKRIFDGSLSLMLIHYAKHKKISRAEIQELKRIIDNMEV